MKRILTLFTALAISGLAIAHDDPKISVAKIAELSAHRIDRLVTLGKVDASYVKKMARIEVSAINEGAASYKSLVSQTGEKPNQLELTFDHDGKPLSFKVIPGVAGVEVEWTGKNAGELIENGMHYVLDNSKDPVIAPYFSKFTALTLSKGKLGAADVALLEISSSAQTQKLRVLLNLDGTVNSTEVVP